LLSSVDGQNRPSVKGSGVTASDKQARDSQGDKADQQTKGSDADRNSIRDAGDNKSDRNGNRADGRNPALLSAVFYCGNILVL